MSFNKLRFWFNSHVEMATVERKMTRDAELQSRN